MFMNQKKRKLIATVVALGMSFVFILSVVAVYFTNAFNSQTYTNYTQAPTVNTAPVTPIKTTTTSTAGPRVNTAPISASTTTTQSTQK